MRIEHRVDVHQVVVSLKGDYRWQSYNSGLPPHRVFYNSISCKPFVTFISCTILDTLATEVISVWGEVSEVTIPFLWKSSDFIYHSIGLLALRYFCSVSIPRSLYIDERRGELKPPLQTPVSKLSFFSFLIEILQQFTRRQQIISVHMEEILKLPTSTKDSLSSLHFV